MRYIRYTQWRGLIVEVGIFLCPLAIYSEKPCTLDALRTQLVSHPISGVVAISSGVSCINSAFDLLAYKQGSTNDVLVYRPLGANDLLKKNNIQVAFIGSLVTFLASVYHIVREEKKKTKKELKAVSCLHMFSVMYVIRELDRLRNEKTCDLSLVKHLLQGGYCAIRLYQTLKGS